MTKTKNCPRSERKKRPVATNLPAFRKALGEWFATAARDLPWRRTGDPYAILVSEMMLQQTQVATVIAYYHRWMARFPTLEALAAAREEEVLGLWQGLGYYSRAKRLAAAARQVVEEHGGRFPRELEAIGSLPGVGPYTAAAVATFAFDLPTPPIDGNIARVVARLTDDATPVDSVAGMKAMRHLLEGWQPGEAAGVFNEALMELGALICTPRSPACLVCPVEPFCLAQEPERLPVKKPRAKTVELEERCGWIVGAQGILLEQQTGRRWNGLWRLPLLPEGMVPGEERLVLTYPFTHHRVTLRVYDAALPPGVWAPNWAWYRPAVLEALAMTAPHRRALQRLLS